MTPPIRPELGRRYRTRDGRITSELRANFEGSPYPFVAEVDGERRSWDSAGRFSAAFRGAPLDSVEVLP